MSESTTRGEAPRESSALVPFFAANVLFGAGLFAHAFLYNFYLDALGFGESAMGLAAAFLTGGGLLALAPAGIALDRWGARRLYFAAVLVAAAGLWLGAWAERSWVVFAAAGVAGMGAASWRVAMGPLLMATSDPGLRSRAFSWNVALLLLSGAAWIALSGSVSAWAGEGGNPLQGLRTALWLGALGTAAAGAVFLLTPLGRTVAPTARDGAPGGAQELLGVPRSVLILVGGVFVWMLGAALVMPFLNLYFQRVQGMEVHRIGMLFAGAQAVAALAVFGGGELARALGPRRAFALWAVILPVTLLGLAAGPALLVAIPLFLLQGLPSPATNPLLDEIVLDAAPPARHGAASSWRNAATEGSGLAGAAIGGLVLERSGFGPLLSVGAAVALLGALGLMRAFRVTAEA